MLSYQYAILLSVCQNELCYTSIRTQNDAEHGGDTMKENMEILILNHGKTAKVLLKNCPDVYRRIQAVEKYYGVDIISCTYQPAAGKLLTMKYQSAVQSAALQPKSQNCSESSAEDGYHTLRRKVS